MLITDLVRISIRQIVRNRRRYKSAIIGTTLGIAGLIAVMTTGDSVESVLGRNLEILGAATIIKAQWEDRKTVRWHYGEYFPEDVEALRKLKSAMVVAPAAWRWVRKARYQKKKTVARLGGVGPLFFEAVYLPVAQGRRITAQDVKQRKDVCLIGENVQKALFGPNESPLGRTIIIQGNAFKVVGLLGSAEDPDFLRTILIPLSVAKAKVYGLRRVRDIYIRAQNWDVVPDLHARVEAVLKKNQPGYADFMLIRYYKDRITTIKTIAFIFKFFLYASIVVTLILGGLGITNVMLAVVKERTTEIGLRKAVGATERMIMSQFLCESLAVSLIGAVLGIVIGTLAVEALNRVLDLLASYDVFMFSVFASVVIGVFLGVLSGVIPARTAGRLDAVDAMRFE
jgi:putative ABC transport system permease protein